MLPRLSSFIQSAALVVRLIAKTYTTIAFEP